MNGEGEDLVNRPKHYTSHPSGVECIQVTEGLGFCLGSMVKYLWRSGLKGATKQDFQKARWYLKREYDGGHDAARGWLGACGLSAWQKYLAFEDAGEACTAMYHALQYWLHGDRLELEAAGAAIDRAIEGAKE